MGNCSTCSSGNGKPNGCKSNGFCATDGCNKLTVFDWLANMNIPSVNEVDYVEIRYKNNRKLYYKNERNLQLNIGDVVALEASPGHDIGIVSLTGELVKLQMNKKNVSSFREGPKIVYRHASQKDIDKWQQGREKEAQTVLESRKLIKQFRLNMKLADVEYQGDGTKAIFYYTAEERVDFRELIKELAGKFSVRIEMKQIGFRQEAALVGGIGSCGRELCCSTWLTDFRSVNTTAARYQQLSINPQKLAGQCGKLKCCLNFELDSYLDSLKSFPSSDLALKTKKGLAFFQKMDIFKELVWYSYKDNPMVWFKLSLEDVNDIILKNKKGEKVDDLEELIVIDQVKQKDVGFENVVGQDNLDRFNTKTKRKRKPRTNKNNSGNKPRPNRNSKGNAAKEGAENPQGSKPNTRKPKPNRNSKGNAKEGAENPQGSKPNARKPRPNRNSKGNAKEGAENPQGSKPNTRKPKPNRNSKGNTAKEGAENPQGSKPNTRKPKPNRNSKGNAAKEGAENPQGSKPNTRKPKPNRNSRGNAAKEGAENPQGSKPNTRKPKPNRNSKTGNISPENKGENSKVNSPKPNVKSQKDEK